jgi:Zn-dependent metalloprotease
MITTVIAIDGLDQERQIVIEPYENKYRLHDPTRNIHTHDFQLHNINLEKHLLPGDYVFNPPSPWDVSGVSAHANLAEISDFLNQYLQLNGIDGLGCPFICSVNYGLCGQTYESAAWVPYLGKKQIVFGQMKVDGQFLSLAVKKEIVAHEVFHGVTRNTEHEDGTRGLLPFSESGALDESYSDIFGILFANFGNPDIHKWDWEIGKPFGNQGKPIRDLSQPENYGQPSHYSRFIRRRRHDSMNNHDNSGIHNKVAHIILNTADEKGDFLFTAIEIAQLFYQSLLEQLSETSGFSDSRRGLETTASLRFRTDPRKEKKLKAISDAFDNVGISYP